jgi:hypothetical protein
MIVVVREAMVFFEGVDPVDEALMAFARDHQHFGRRAGQLGAVPVLHPVGEV